MHSHYSYFHIEVLCPKSSRRRIQVQVDSGSKLKIYVPTLNNTNGRTYRTKANMYSLPSTCSYLTYYVLKYNNDKIIFLRVILQVVFNIKGYLIYLDIINVFL
jgi:hypothetical protein